MDNCLKNQFLHIGVYCLTVVVGQMFSKFRISKLLTLYIWIFCCFVFLVFSLFVCLLVGFLGVIVKYNIFFLTYCLFYKMC